MRLPEKVCVCVCVCVLLTSTGSAQIAVKNIPDKVNSGQIMVRFHQPTEQEIIIVVEQRGSGSQVVFLCCSPAFSVLSCPHPAHQSFWLGCGGGPAEGFPEVLPNGAVH